MSPTANAHVGQASALQTLYSPIRHELAEVEKILQRELRSQWPYVDELVRYGCLLGGKRLRPALLLLAAQATGSVNQQHLLLAAVMEMIHTATLIHDDVLDEADKRRHLQTVNARWNTESSVLLGDFLFTHAFYLASSLDSTLACRLIGRATNIVCEGELRQIGTRGDFSLTEEEYLQIIEAKTAELCACCCRLGALYAGAEGETVELLGRYGRLLGIAFQIADDLLDIQGDESMTGKSLGSDLKKQKATLPLIHTLQRAEGLQRQQLMALVEADPPLSPEMLLPWLQRYEALQYTRSRALHYAALARQQLEGLPVSEARQVLTALADFVVLRSA